MNLIEFIDESNACQSVEELTNKFLCFIAQYGFDQFVMSEMSHDTTSQKETHHGILVNYPKEWMDHYVANHYIDHDPVYQSALTARKPFSWKAVTEHPTTSDIAVKVMNEARECKLHDGIALAIHQPLGQIIGMGFSGSEKGVECNKTVASYIHAAANHFFVIYGDLTGWHKIEGPNPNLTRREKEILFWLSRGKSRSDIADICKISESAINRHCEKAFEKLSVNNATIAAAKAIRMGLITPF